MTANVLNPKVFKYLFQLSLHGTWTDRESFVFKPNVKLGTFKFLLLDQVYTFPNISGNSELRHLMNRNKFFILHKGLS